jgi:hypothetical protein
MLTAGDVNPLSVFGLRQLEHCPPHFAKVGFDSAVEDKRVTDWVWENLTGRFYFGDQYVEDANGPKYIEKVIAFELHSEASYFALFLNEINKPELL